MHFDPSIRYQARPVSASKRTKIYHVVQNNSQIVGIKTIRILVALFSVWFKLAKIKDKMTLFTRDVKRLFLQSNSSLRLVYYKLAPDFHTFRLFFGEKIWRTETWLYGNVKLVSTEIALSFCDAAMLS